MDTGDGSRILSAEWETSDAVMQGMIISEFFRYQSWNQTLQNGEMTLQGVRHEPGLRCWPPPGRNEACAADFTVPGRGRGGSRSLKACGYQATG